MSSLHISALLVQCATGAAHCVKAHKPVTFCSLPNGEVRCFLLAAQLISCCRLQKHVQAASNRNFRKSAWNKAHWVPKMPLTNGL